MSLTVRQLIWILQMFFPPELPVQQALYVLGVLICLYPILGLHNNQRRAPHQPAFTGWMKSIHAVLADAFRADAIPLNDASLWGNGIGFGPETEYYARYLCNDIDRLSQMMGLHNDTQQDPLSSLVHPPRPIIVTSRVNCRFCPPGDSNIVPSLRRRPKKHSQNIWLLDSSFRWVSATLLVGYCARCRADYYPDKITRPGPNGGHRTQVLEYDAKFLRVSKSGVWAHRRMAVVQEKTLYRLHGGWSNFADWLNDITEDINVKLTWRQSQRLFIEHFSRRLLVAHGKNTQFVSDAHSTTKTLANAVRQVIGRDGGVVPYAMTHGCLDCTHLKQYASAINQDMFPEASTDVVGSNSGPADNVMDPRLTSSQIDVNDSEYQPLPPNMPPVLPQQIAPAEGSPRGYIRLAVMDGKGITHKKCALDDCRGPLVNFKNGRFCQEHLHQTDVCGILPCGREVHSPGALTCDNQSHINWHKQWEERFHRHSFPGVQRVIRRQAGSDNSRPEHGIRAATFQVELQPLGETPGSEVNHTFKSQRTFCLQTIQWACGFPIGWGKCYKSESTPQVLSFINKIWDAYPTFRPSFIAYDRACDLLRHIVTQNPDDIWITTTKFIVDAWHYIHHRATDVLCRTRCNPAPSDGSQPDLVRTDTDANGTIHRTRAFNTETAEQFNSWLSRFEAQLRQMTDSVEKKVSDKGRDLTDEFWDAVKGIVDMDIDSA
ncbi:hypothetical protein R3P38DRAFT_2502011 [Favolaschia claudopus]|uniref:CxC5 like cysteine cluster associated with KDZ domain-containing protein n=1 Tax=Favolaschia claudopus TaxID=2862362 RepID=A0AAW0DFQ9_9AGAR